jgi:FkbM family methyltransferase
MIERVLAHSEFSDAPPVLLDVGASGRLHDKWQDLAKYSVCIAFDPDARDMTLAQQHSDLFRELHVMDQLVVSDNDDRTGFYFTRSPHCSSTLEPDRKGLRPWSFANLFETVNHIEVTSTTLGDVLNRLVIDHVDWIKIDSQGTDLKLFRSLPDLVRKRVLAVEMEPGILDAYRGEDKLHAVMAYMDLEPFWMSSMEIKGAQRLSTDFTRSRMSPGQTRWLMRGLRTSPGWCEVTYLRSLSDECAVTKRDLLLACVFATIENQFGAVLELAARGHDTFGEPLFLELMRYATRRARLSALQHAATRCIRTPYERLLSVRNARKS